MSRSPSTCTCIFWQMVGSSIVYLEKQAKLHEPQDFVVSTTFPRTRSRVDIQ